MNTLLTLYLAGMPLAAATLLWALQGVGEEDWRDLVTVPGFAALCCAARVGGLLAGVFGYLNL